MSNSYTLTRVDRSACTKVSADKYEHINHLMEIKEMKERVSNGQYPDRAIKQKNK